MVCEDSGAVHVHQMMVTGWIKKTIVEWECVQGEAICLRILATYKSQLIAITTKPDAVAVPDNLYDVYLWDEHEADILSGDCENQPNDASKRTTFAKPIALYGRHSLIVMNAGDESKGTIVLYTKE